MGEACLVLGGDLNFPAVGEGRLDATTGRVTLTDEAVSGHFDDVFWGMCEVAGDRPTRRGLSAGTLSTLSRIDRLFLNMLPSELVERGANVCVLDDLSNEGLLSDHSPILLSLGCLSLSVGRPCGVPCWVSSRSDFPALVSEVFDRSGAAFGEGPFDRLLSYKKALSKAASMIISKATASDCVSASCRLFWISSAKSAVRARNSVRLARAVDRFPLLSSFFDCPGCAVSDPTGLHKLICELNCEDLRGQLSANDGSSIDEEGKSRRRAKLHTRLASWSPKGKSVVGITVLGDDGNPTDEAGGFEALERHWGPVFNSSVADFRAMSGFKRFIVKCPVDLAPLAKDEFVKMCSVVRRSAPGPDGIVYTAWSACGEEAAFILYDCYKGIMAGEAVPEWFNLSTLVFIPKGDSGGSAGVQARPGDLRPLSLSNADQKLLALAINSSLNMICEGVVHPSQRGFRRGKLVTDNVLELEARVIKELYLGARHPAMLLLDIKAAFPSVAWELLWFVLDAMDCHKWLFSAIRALYVGSSAVLAAGRMRGGSIDVTSGIKQGCPMSGSLWNIIFDPVIRCLLEALGTCGSLSAFADDIGIATGDVITVLSRVVPVLGSVQAATCLTLNWGKTFLVNFSRFSVFKIRNLIEEVAPLALRIVICKFAKYLGFIVGPGAGEHEWTAPCSKLLCRARHVKTLGLSLVESIAAFCVFAFSVVRYSLQLLGCSPVLEWHFGLALDITTSSPRFAMGEGVLTSLRRLGLPLEVP